MTKKKILIISTSFALPILLVGGVLYFAYHNLDNKFSTGIFKTFPLPALQVGESRLTVHQYLGLRDAYIKTDSKISKTEIDTRLQRVMLISNLSKQNSKEITSEEVEAQIKKNIEDLAGGNKDLFYKQVSKTFGLNEEGLRTLIIKPGLEEKKLRIWFYGEGRVSKNFQANLEGVLKESQTSEDFEITATRLDKSNRVSTLAKKGMFMQISELDALLQEKLKSATAGSVVTVPSEEGVVIVRVKSISKKDPSYMELQFMELKSDEFEKWLSEKQKSITLKSYLPE